jgi:L-alanine-DL-glutamate epimerase-like enolase superfamily enzyme
MQKNRRGFLRSAVAVGCASTLAPVAGARAAHPAKTDYAVLDAARKQPVLKRQLFPDPVVIASIELLRDRNNFLCRVRSKDGAEGLSVGHPFISKQSYPLFVNRLVPFFTGKDARDLDQLLYRVSESSVKVQGVPFCVQIATLEFAILDMLGSMVNRPAGQLIGDVLNPEVSIYLGNHLSDFRKREPEVSLEMMERDRQRTGAKAIKLRAGRGDNLASDIDNAPGRTEKLIRMAREKYGDRVVLMIDGNGSYGVQEAIRIGKILEEYDYYFYEEPVPWDWYEEQKQVEQAVSIPMAGGEEEFGMHAFRYLIGNEVFQILQPDLFYFGGMVRTMQVARMVAAAGLQVTPPHFRRRVGLCLHDPDGVCMSGGGRVSRVQDVQPS